MLQKFICEKLLSTIYKYIVYDKYNKSRYIICYTHPDYYYKWEGYKAVCLTVALQSLSAETILIKFAKNIVKNSKLNIAYLYF